jgi:hypothetical protein
METAKTAQTAPLLLLQAKRTAVVTATATATMAAEVDSERQELEIPGGEEKVQVPRRRKKTAHLVVVVVEVVVVVLHPVADGTALLDRMERRSRRQR